MSNKTELQSNNNDLQLLINKANSLETINSVAQATPSITVNSSGLITATANQEAGRVSAGTKSATKQLTTQAAKTVTPTKNSQTAVASGVYTTGTITVGAIPSNYIVPSGTKTITTNGTHDVKSYASATVNIAAAEDLAAEITQYGNLNDELESVINSLPEAGSGGVPETCTITITARHAITDPDPDSKSIQYIKLTDNGAVYDFIPSLQPSTITLDKIVKGSFMIIKASLIQASCSGGAEMIYGDYLSNYTTRITLIFIDGDGQITLTNPAEGY